MSNLKYKSATSTSTNSSNSTSQPIWCSLTTPSQIARKYASIAPIWCHISRPRQLKKKFASTLHQAQNLLTRQHSRENTLNLNGTNHSSSNLFNGVGGSSYPSSSSTGVANNNNKNNNHHGDLVDDEIDQINELNTYKNTAANSNTSNWTSTAGIMADSSSSSTRKDSKTSSSDLTGRLLGNHDSHDTYAHDYDVNSRLSLRKRDSSLDNRPFRKPDSRFKMILFSYYRHGV
jgi:hypothetical protein